MKFETLNNFFNNPNALPDKLNKLSLLYLVLNVLLILFSVGILYTELKHPDYYQKYFFYLEALYLVILFIFFGDYLLRILASQKKLNYLLSFNGIVDFLAVMPGILSLLVGLGSSLSWLRVLRLFTLGKLFNSFRSFGFFTGITNQILCVTVGIMSIKLLMTLLESNAWYPKFDNISLLLGLISFSLAMLLGTKLSIVNTRLHSIEDAVSRVAAGAKVFWYTKPSCRKDLIDWVNSFYYAITHTNKDEMSSLRKKTNALYKSIGEDGINPNLVGFSRDIAYITNRATAQVHEAYEKFLRDVIFIFTIAVVIVVSGLTGLAATFVLSYIFFGMFFLIEDMDNPLDYSKHSMITVKLEPITEFIANHKIEETI